MLRWVLYVVVGLAALVGIVALAGLMVPKGHRASGAAIVPLPPADVFAIISNFGETSQWRSNVRAVRQEGSGAGARIVEDSRDGTMTYRLEVYDPPRRMVMRIDDPSLPFGGTWTYDLDPVPEGTRLTITEDGEIFNPVFRFMARFVFGYRATLDRYLTDLKQRAARR